MVIMSQAIQIRDDIYNQLKTRTKPKEVSFSDVIDNLLNKNDNLQEATITQEGRISKVLAGKTILYRIK